MGKLALTVVGMGIGFALGGPFGAQIGAMVGGMVGNILFAPTVKGPRLTDLTVTASTYGQVIAELYGTMRVGGNMIWTAGIKEHKHKSGGKGGPKSVTYSYTASFAIAFCKGEVDGITRIWADGKLIAGTDPTKTTGTGEILATSGILNLTKKAKGKFSYRFYSGSENQMPDSTIVAKEGEGKVPGYRGLAYLIFIDMPLEDFGNRIPQITAEITRNPVPTAPYVKLSNDTSHTAGPTASDFSQQATVDWESNLYCKTWTDPDTGDFYLIKYDLRSMTELYRVKVPLVPGGANFQPPSYDGPADALPSFNQAFSIGGNYFWANTAIANSGSGEMYDATSGTPLGRIGHPSNGFPANPNPDTSQPFYPEGAMIGTFGGTARWFRILSALGQQDILYHTGNLESNPIMWTPGRSPVHWLNFFSGQAASWWTMRGKEQAATTTETAYSEMLFTRSIYNLEGDAKWHTYLKVVSIREGAVMKQVEGPPFSMINNPLNTETDIELPFPFEGEDFAISRVAYDKSDNSLVLWGYAGVNNFGFPGGTPNPWRFCKYLIDEGIYKWAWKADDLDPALQTGPELPGDQVNVPIGDATTSSLDGGTVGWIRPKDIYGPSYIYVADLQTGRITTSVITPLPGHDSAGFIESSWDDQTQSVVGAQPRIFIRAPGQGVSLQSIVDDVLTRTGQLEPGADWDSSDLADINVHGYVISREATARDILNQLAGAYFFDGVESDYIIKCVLRGKAPIVNLSQSHLAFVENRDITIKETRQQETELPMRVSVTYSDIDRNYQDGTQSAKRNTNPFPTMHSHNEVKIELPIALTATEAKQIADKSMKMSWAGRNTYKTKLPWEFIKYDPTDVITITMDSGTVYQLRLDKIDMGVDFSLEVDGVSDRAVAYVSTVVAATGSIPPQSLNVGGPCDLFVLNTPLLRDVDDTQGVSSVFYITAKGKSPGDFISCYVFEATDSSGDEFEDINVVPTEPTWGTTLTALPAHYDYGLDPNTTLTVRIMSVDEDLNPDVLESCTDDEILAGKNSAIVGDEIIQFKTATPRSDGRTYDLTNILRARRGTNYATRAHKVSERFVMLEQNGSVIASKNAPAEWDQTHLFKAVPSGTYSEDATIITANMEPNDLKPYTPEQVQIADDGTNITVNFERRSRIGNEMNDGAPNVPYKEGQGSLAHFVYKVWGNKLLSDAPWDAATAPDFTDVVPIYSGVSFAPLTFQFAYAGMTSFVIELYEVGYVNGFPKYVQFVNVPGTSDWDMTELY